LDNLFSELNGEEINKKNGIETFVVYSTRESAYFLAPK